MAVEDLRSSAPISTSLADLAEHPISTIPSVGASSRPLSSPIAADLPLTFDEMLRRADEEYELRMAGEHHLESVIEDEELADQADIEMGSDVTGVEGHHLTWDELKEIADREYDERHHHSAAASEVLSASPSSVASVSVASADDRASVVSELSEVDWEEWRYHRDGDEEHQRHREDESGGTAPSAPRVKKPSRSQARRTAPRAVARVVRFFRVGKEVVRFLYDGAVITPLAILK